MELLAPNALQNGPTERWTARCEFDFALDSRDQIDLRWYLERYLQNPSDPAPAQAAEVERRIEAPGAELFCKVFQASEDGRNLWAQTDSRAADLRVEIHTDVREAASVPWELLRDPKTDFVLALTAAAFVRSSSNQAVRPVVPELAGAVRVLLVVCRPAQGDDVPFRSVVSRLVKTLGGDGARIFSYGAGVT